MAGTDGRTRWNERDRWKFCPGFDTIDRGQKRGEGAGA